MTTTGDKVATHQFDVIVGGGGAGLYAALELATGPGLRIAGFSNLHPLRSYTVAAQGGICAALGHAESAVLMKRGVPRCGGEIVTWVPGSTGEGGRTGVGTKAGITKPASGARLSRSSSGS